MHESQLVPSRMTHVQCQTVLPPTGMDTDHPQPEKWIKTLYKIPIETFDPFSYKPESENVVKTCNKTLLIHNSTTFPNSLGPLAKQTILDLYSFFQEYTRHRPSKAMWEALVDLASTLECMVNGECESSFYLSSLDPGVGKTQTISRFIRVLLASSDHQNVGVVICVSRLSEIESLVADMGLNKDDFGVFTSDKDMNRLGCGSPAQGRVLFTTQQMVEQRCLGKRFDQAEEFLFKGKVRQVRIWDETILPGQPVTINRLDLPLLMRPLVNLHEDLAISIEDLFMSLKDAPDGSTCQLPDFEGEYGVGINKVLRALNQAPEDVQKTASNLWSLSGKIVTIRTDGRYGNTFLEYRDTLPYDLPPVVVLDASGRVRATYDEWESKRGGLVRLKSAKKAYDNLTVHAWNTGGGKSSFRSNGRNLMEGIADTINTKPDQEWLVVCHKSNKDYDVEATVRDLVKVKDQDELHFITWGNHHATNEFSRISNVILAGTLFYRASHYEALGRLSANKRAEDGEYPKESFRRIELGEHAHLVLQALCRGSVRVCQDGQCAPCDAYIIASSRSGVVQALPTIFPGCTVKPWKPVRTILKGKIREAVDFIDDWFQKNPEEKFLPFKLVRAAIGVSNSGNFTHNIRRHEDFMEALVDRNIIEDGRGKNKTGFRRITAEDYGFTPVVQ